MPGPTPERNLVRRLLQLEQQLRQLLRTLTGRRDAQLVPRPQVRLGQVVTVASAPANTFGVVFCDGTFPGAEGNQTPTLTKHDPTLKQVIAHNLCGHYVRNLSRVIVVEIGRYWWIVRDFGPARWIEFTVNQAYGFDEDDAEVTVEVTSFWDGSDPDPEDEGITVLNTCGMFSGPDGICGLATYDDVLDDYRIVQLKCVADAEPEDPFGE